MKRAYFSTLALAAMFAPARADDLVTPVPEHSARPKGDGTVARGQRFPDLTIYGAERRKILIPNDDGKAIWLAFFASWCPPCRREIPALVEAAKRHPEELTVIGMDFFEEPYRAAVYVQAEKIPFIVATQGTMKTGAFRSMSLPAGILIDKTGIVQDIWVGIAAEEGKPLGDHLQQLGIED